jgi:hypothetical protein
MLKIKIRWWTTKIEALQSLSSDTKFVSSETKFELHVNRPLPSREDVAASDFDVRGQVVPDLVQDELDVFF